MIDLYLLRHGIAVEPGTPGYNEENRPLTPEGRDKMETAAEGMRKLGIAFEALWASPLLRARETAEIVKALLPFKGKVEIEKGLLPGSSLRGLLEKLKDRREKSFLLAGHEPSLSEWIHSLLGADPGHSILMKKGALCHLKLHGDLRYPEAELLGLWQPRSLRLCAG